MTITARIDNVTKIPHDRLSVRPPAPRSVKIEITGKCNFRCGFCALRTREKQPLHDMDMAFFKRITKEMLEAGVEEIGLFYLGESLMAPDLAIECVRYLKSIGCKYVFLTSNGALATMSVVYDLMEAGLDSLKWSVNAADDEQFEKVMGVPAKNYLKAISNIKTAHEVRERYGFKTGLYASSILFDEAQREAMEPVLAMVRPYVDEHYWLPLYTMGSFAEERNHELGFRATAGNQGRLGALREPLPCWSVMTEGHVTVDGKLSACCFDAHGNWEMGDLTKQSFMDAWHSEAFTDLRAHHLRKDVTGTACEKCVAYK